MGKWKTAPWGGFCAHRGLYSWGCFRVLGDYLSQNSQLPTWGKRSEKKLWMRLG